MRQVNVLFLRLAMQELPPEDVIVEPDQTVHFQIPTRFGNPNLRKNDAHYLWALNPALTGFPIVAVRLWHIAAIRDEGHYLTLVLGNTFISKSWPGINSSNHPHYIPLHEFGMQELQPGTLVPIVAPGFGATPRSEVPAASNG